MRRVQWLSGQARQTHVQLFPLHHHCRLHSGRDIQIKRAWKAERDWARKNEQLLDTHFTAHPFPTLIHLFLFLATIYIPDNLFASYRPNIWFPYIYLSLCNQDLIGAIGRRSKYSSKQSPKQRSDCTRRPVLARTHADVQESTNGYASSAPCTFFVSRID